MAKMTKAKCRKRVQESIGKLSMVRESGHLTKANAEFLWKTHQRLMNIATQLK